MEGVLPNLQQVHFNGAADGLVPQIGDKGVEALIQALRGKALPRLKSIGLDFNTGKFSEETMRLWDALIEERSKMCIPLELVLDRRLSPHKTSRGISVE